MTIGNEHGNLLYKTKIYERPALSEKSTRNVSNSDPIESERSERVIPPRNAFVSGRPKKALQRTYMVKSRQVGRVGGSLVKKNQEKWSLSLPLRMPARWQMRKVKGRMA